MVLNNDLTVDTNTLVVDSTNNRVGILNAFSTYSFVGYHWWNEHDDRLQSQCMNVPMTLAANILSPDKHKFTSLGEEKQFSVTGSCCT